MTFDICQREPLYSLDKSARYWVARDFIAEKSTPLQSFKTHLLIVLAHFYFRRDSDLHKHILSGCRFVSFPDCEEDQYFIKRSTRGSWNSYLSQSYIDMVTVLREQVQHFDLGLQHIIFGKGGTHIYQFETGFIMNFEGNHEDPNHIFRQVNCPSSLQV